MTIYEISENYQLVARKILNFARKNNISSSLVKELEDLAHQCELASEYIIRDFADEGVANDNLLKIINMFNEIVLKD